MTLALEADGHEITTVEGLMSGEELGPTSRRSPRKTPPVRLLHAGPR